MCLFTCWPSLCLLWKNVCSGLLGFLFIFNWRSIALQYCVSLPHTSTWIGHRCTDASSLLNLPPVSHPRPPRRLSQSPRLELPVSHSQFPLGVYFTHGNVYVSALLFQFVPLLSPLCPQVSSLCLHPRCCPANRLISTIFLDSIYVR